jgi:ATP-dependent protease ClpP protease subunit
VINLRNLCVIGALLIGTTGLAKVKKPVRDIHINGVIAGYNMLDAADRVWMMSKISKKPIKVYINSGGGSIYAGMQFINAMIAAQKRGVKFKCYVTGIAMSMAFQIYTYCDQRYALPFSLLLWHPPRISGIDALTPAAARMALRELTELEKELIPQLVSSLGLNKRYVMLHYKDETVWTARRLERVTDGFLHVITNIPGTSGVWNDGPGSECIDFCTDFDWEVRK